MVCWLQTVHVVYGAAHASPCPGAVKALCTTARKRRGSGEQATDSSVNCTSRDSERLTGTQPLNWKSVAKCFVCNAEAAVVWSC